MTDEQMDNLSRSLGMNPFGAAIRGLIAEVKSLRKENATLKADGAVMALAFADYGKIEQPALELARKQERERIEGIIHKMIYKLTVQLDTGWDSYISVKRIWLIDLLSKLGMQDG